MTAFALFHESLSDALRECIAACGGTKVVGTKLWPEKGADVAGRLVSDCLNEAKREKFSPEQVLLILRMAREQGCHAGMVYLARDLGYEDPRPVEPEDAKARLQREFIEATRMLARLAERLGQVEQMPALRKVG